MASANIVNLTQQNFADEVLKSATPILVDFWGEYCPPCRMIAPILDELAEEYSGRVRIGKVNVENEQALAVEYRITAVPTLLLFQNGQVVQQIRGARSKKEFKASLDQVAA
jgi:thioredoxin 1